MEGLGGKAGRQWSRFPGTNMGQKRARLVEQKFIAANMGGFFGGHHHLVAGGLI